MKIKYNILKLIFLFSILIGCKDIVVQPPESNLNMEDFEAIWSRVDQVYPFLEFKNIDWDSIHTVYHERVANAKGDEFYSVMSDLLAELKDGHVYFHTDGGAEVYPFYPKRYYRDKGGYNPFVVRSYFDKKMKLTDSRSAEYEILPDNIGYVFLSSFHEYYLVNEFPGIMNYLKNTKGMIIDIRQRRGGTPDNVIAVAKWFITEPLPFLKLYFLNELTLIQDIIPESSFQYTNPVVVLINGATFSAGEITAEVLKHIPTVIAVGDTTGGGSGVGGGKGSTPPEIVSDYYLPSGKLISTPTGYMERYDGVPFEWNGIIPDVRIVQSVEDAKNGRDFQLEYAINYLK
jgi:hypothetical protein